MQVILPTVALAGVGTDLQGDTHVGEFAIEIEMPFDHHRLQVGGDAHLGRLLDLRAPAVLQGPQNDEQDTDAQEKGKPEVRATAEFRGCLAIRGLAEDGTEAGQPKIHSGEAIATGSLFTGGACKEKSYFKLTGIAVICK